MFDRKLMFVEGVADCKATDSDAVGHGLRIVAVVDRSLLSALHGKSAIFFAVLQLSMLNTVNDAMLAGEATFWIESR